MHDHSGQVGVRQKSSYFPAGFIHEDYVYGVASNTDRDLCRAFGITLYYIGWPQTTLTPTAVLPCGLEESHCSAQGGSTLPAHPPQHFQPSMGTWNHTPVYRVALRTTYENLSVYTKRIWKSHWKFSNAV